MDNSAVDQAIVDLIEPRTKVLDLGCGEGDLLKSLEVTKQVQGQGIEISEEAIYKCVEKGLTVYHGDIDTGLSEFPDASFDYVVLNGSLPEVREVDFVFDEALRVGRRVVVSFPNFVQLSARLYLLFKGEVPVISSLPHPWFDTPTLRFLSIRDFKSYCRLKNLTINRNYFFWNNFNIKWLPNLLASHAIFEISKSH